MKIQMETFDGEYWAKLDLSRHYNFTCPVHEDREGGHGIVIEPWLWAFEASDKDYEEGELRCSCKGCPGAIKYVLRKV